MDESLGILLVLCLFLSVPVIWFLLFSLLFRKYLTALEKASAELHREFMNIETGAFYFEVFYDRFQQTQMLRRNPHANLPKSKIKTKLNILLNFFRLVYVTPFVGVFTLLFITIVVNP